MTATVAMYDKSYAHIRPRLDALGLDLVVHTFGKDGKFSINGAKVAPADVTVDYLWLSSHLNADGFRDGAFEANHLLGDFFLGNGAARHGINAIVREDQNLAATNARRHGDAVQNPLALVSSLWHAQ